MRMSEGAQIRSYILVPGFYFKIKELAAYSKLSSWKSKNSFGYFQKFSERITSHLYTAFSPFFD